MVARSQLGRIASDVVTDYKTDFGSVGVSTMPVYTVPADEPAATITVSPNCIDFTSDTGTEVPIPSYASLNGSSDGPLVLFQPSTDSEWEFWAIARHSSTSYSACWGGKLDTATTSAVFPAPYGLSASGISYLATTITEADVASGSIDHTISVGLPRCNRSVYPADRTDCSFDSGQPGEGQWFRFRPARHAERLEPIRSDGVQSHTDLWHGSNRPKRRCRTRGGAAKRLGRRGRTGPDPITTSWDGLFGYQVVAGLPWSSLQAVDPPEN